MANERQKKHIRSTALERSVKYFTGGLPNCLHRTSADEKIITSWYRGNLLTLFIKQAHKTDIFAPKLLAQIMWGTLWL